MSDEPSSSAAAASNAVDEPEQDVPLTATQLAEKRKKNRQMFNRKRGELLDDLTRNLDILIYAELSAVYYMECVRIHTCLGKALELIIVQAARSYAS